MNITYFFIYFILFLWAYWLWTRRKFYTLMFKIRGPLGYPLFGKALDFIRREDVLPALANLIKKYGLTFFSWLGPYPILVVTDPNIVQELLTSPYCVNKAFFYNALDKVVAKGLFSLNQPEWKVHRKLLNPAFSHKVLMSFIPIFNSDVNRLLKEMDQMTKMGAVDLMDVIQEFSLNVATKTTMGKSESVESNESFKDLLPSYHIILQNLIDNCLTYWLNLSLIRRLLGISTPCSEAKNKIQQFVRELVEQKLNAVNNGRESATQNIFVDLAIDAMRRGNFSYQNVEDESNVIVFGAFETTANTITYTLMLLAMFPEYQDRAFEELVSIFPEPGGFEVTYGNTKDMTYMDMVLNEAMRLMAPVPLVGRQVSQDFKLSNGITLPKGLQIGIDIFHMHRREDIWGPDAQLFNPNHFLPSNLEGKHPYGFIPFTKGIRDCIGSKYALLSTKIALAKILRNYEFATDFKFEDLVFVEDVTIKLKHNPLLRIKKRTK